MEQIIKQVAAEAGLAEASARDATTALLGYLRDAVPAEKMAPLYAGVPGAEELAGGAKRGFFNTGIFGLYNSLANAGLSTDQMRKAGETLLREARNRAGDEAVDDVIQSVPMLRQIL